MGDSDEYTYIYLDFNEKLTSNVFSNKLFLRVANLHKPNPLVQINDLVFKGSYDECIGTNIFFEEIKDPPQKNIFEKETPIHLKPTTTQTKIINLKQMKLPRKVVSNKSTQETATLNLNQDYATLLDKLEQGNLNIEDLSQTEPQQSTDEALQSIAYEPNEVFYTEPESELESYLGLLGDQSKTALLEAKYERLKRLARRPVKRMKSPERTEPCDPKYREKYELSNLEHQILQSSDAFRSAASPILEKTFLEGVDIDRCVLHGLIAPSPELHRTLSNEEQSKVFSIDNFENLSIPARYLVLKECTAKIETLIENTPAEELAESDENGRSLSEISAIFRSLLATLELHVAHAPEAQCQVQADERPEDEYVKYKYRPEVLEDVESLNGSDDDYL